MSKETVLVEMQTKKMSPFPNKIERKKKKNWPDTANSKPITQYNVYGLCCVRLQQ